MASKAAKALIFVFALGLIWISHFCYTFLQILVQLISLLIFSHTFLASSLYLVQRFSILYFTFDNGLEIRTETLRLFILCQFLLILNFKLARCFSELFLYYGTQDKKCAIKSNFKHHKQSSKNPFEIEFGTCF